MKCIIIELIYDIQTMQSAAFIKGLGNYWVTCVKITPIGNFISRNFLKVENFSG